MAESKLKISIPTKILLLEDYPEDADLIKRQLLKYDPTWKITIAEDRGEYLKELTESKPNIIVSDYALPTIDGFEAMQLAIHFRPFIPFVFITGAIGEEIAADTILNGASGLILKSNLKALPPLVNKLTSDQKKKTNARIQHVSKRIYEQINMNVQILENIKLFLKNDNINMPDNFKENIQKSLNEMSDLKKNLYDDLD